MWSRPHPPQPATRIRSLCLSGRNSPPSRASARDPTFLWPSHGDAFGRHSPRSAGFVFPSRTPAEILDAPNGIGAPKGLVPAITKKLRDAFRIAVASPEFKSACDKIDAPVLYLDGPDYEKYVMTMMQREKLLIERLKLKELIKS